MDKALKRAIRHAPREIKRAFKTHPPDQTYMVGSLIVRISQYLLTENGVWVVPYSEDPMLVGGPGELAMVPIEHLTVMQ